MEGRRASSAYLLMMPLMLCSMRCSGSSTLASFPFSPTRLATPVLEGGREGVRDGLEDVKSSKKF